MTEAGFTQEELALLGHVALAVDEAGEQDVPADDAMPLGYRERLALGDLSW